MHEIKGDKMADKKNRKKNKKDRTSRQVFRKVFFISLIVFTIMGCGFLYVYNMLDKMNTVDIPKTNEELGIKEEFDKNDNIINIALFGVDKRGAGTGRSDSIMIATLDKEHGKIKLTSLLRDLYVEIPGRGMDKLNHAYAYGGPELTIKTINHNFNMNIRDFATVDFDSFEKIIDILGGIEIDIQPNEVRHVPGSVAGKQVLDGKQALAYSRIRKVGTDYARTERQRTVMEGLIRKGISAGITKYPGLLNAVLPYVDTSLTKAETLSLGTSALTSGIKDIEQFRIPVDGHAKSQMINGVSYEVPDTLEDNVEFLHKFIYEDESEIETDLGADE